jgi:hypothetical protein
MEPINPPEARELLGRLNEMEGDELDILITRLKGEQPRREWMVSSNGGKSLCASTLSRDCWPNASRLAAWLEDQQSRGLCLTHELLPWDIYEKRHADPTAALALLCEVNEHEPRFEVRIQCESATMIDLGAPNKTKFRRFDHDDTPAGICLAIARCWCAWRLNLIVEGESQ